MKAFALYAAPYQEARQINRDGIFLLILKPLIAFIQVIYLDSDNLPLMDPEFLFSDPHYQSQGNIFWTDLYCGSIKLFDALQMPKLRNTRQSESGQIVFNRAQNWLVLEWLLWLNTRDKITYKLAYGDKDTFRAAFFLANRLEYFNAVNIFGLGIALHKKAQDASFLINKLLIQFTAN